MITKIISGGLAGLSRELGRLAVEEPAIVDGAMAEVRVIVDRNVRRVFGDASKLETLAQYTQDDRESLGYSANEPLLRTGLLRDGIKSFHEGPVVEIGSEDPVMLFSEVGAVNVKFNTSNPPRPALKTGVLESEGEVKAAFDVAIGIALK